MWNETGRHVWIFDPDRGTTNPLTFDGQNARGIWTPDGDTIIFASNRSGFFGIYSIPAAGGGAEPLTTFGRNLVVTSLSREGEFLFSPGPTLSDIWVSSLDGDREPRPIRQNRFHERNAVFSPDGQWIAFTSDRSRTDEIYVQPYSSEGGIERIEQISNNGGQQPMWSDDGKELFYRSGDKMMVVPIQREPTFKAGVPKLLFEGAYSDAYYGSTSNYDVADDGQRFLMVQSNALRGTGDTLHVVLNWFEELKRLAPTGN
jgi:Tol biopolymer transport system component